MTFATGLSASLNDWLATVAADRTEALKRGARRFTALISPTTELETLDLPDGVGVGDAPVVVLRITRGLHRGGAMQLTASAYLVGSSDDCDVVLRDEAVSPNHCRLERQWSGYCVRDVRTGPPQLITPQTVAYEGGAIEARYEVGGVQFTLHQQAPKSKTARAPQVRHVPSALLVAVIVGVVLAILAVAGVKRAVTKSPTALAQWSSNADQALVAQGFAAVHFGSNSQGQLQVRGLVANPAEKRRLQAWLRGSPYSNAHMNVQLMSDLIEQVRRALADETLKVGLRDARLDIVGSTSRLELKQRIRALIEDLRDTVPVEDRVQYIQADTGPGPLPVTVSSVMVGNPSYFLTDEGTRYFIGGRLPDGAEVLDIGSAQIQFRRQGKVITYELK